MDKTAAPVRRARSDKMRNRTRILEVAERFFTEQGIGGAMENIAKQAGVGPATLYRHFPNRDELLAALLEARYSDAVAHRDAIQREERDPVIALERWLDALEEYATAFDGLSDPLRAALGEDTNPLRTPCALFIETTDAFLAAAQEQGRARATARGRDLFLSTLATSWVRGAALADEESATALRVMVRQGWAQPAEGGPEVVLSPQ